MQQRLIVDSVSLFEVHTVNPALLNTAVDVYGYVGSPSCTLEQVGEPDCATILRWGVTEISMDFGTYGEACSLQDSSLSFSDACCVVTACNLNGVCLSDSIAIREAGKRLGIIVIGTLEFIASLVAAGKLSRSEGEQVRTSLALLRSKGIVRRSATAVQTKKGKKTSYEDPRRERGEDRFSCNN